MENKCGEKQHLIHSEMRFTGKFHWQNPEIEIYFLMTNLHFHKKLSFQNQMNKWKPKPRASKWTKIPVYYQQMFILTKILSICWFLRQGLNIVLELTMYTRLASNSRRYTWLPLLSARIKDVFHRSPPVTGIFLANNLEIVRCRVSHKSKNSIQKMMQILQKVHQRRKI